MKSENKSFGSALKGMILGVAVGSVATMVISNNKAVKKIKKDARTTAESISSLFKMN